MENLEHLKPFIGTWQQVKTENLNKYLKVKGTSFMTRKVIVNSNLTENIDISQDKLVISHSAIGIGSVYIEG